MIAHRIVQFVIKMDVRNVQGDISFIMAYVHHALIIAKLVLVFRSALFVTQENICITVFVKTLAIEKIVLNVISTVIALPV
jgi:hypothetical protein